MAQVDSLEIQIAVSAQKAEAALDSLAKKMGTVGSALNTLGVKSNFTQMSNSFAKMTGNFSSMNKSTKSLTSSMTKLYVGVKTAQRAFRSLADSMQESISYIENLNYFTKAFEQVAEKADYTKFKDLGYASAEEYAKSFAARASELTAKMTGFKIDSNGMLEESGGVSLGINPSDLITTQATFAQMASSMGATSEQSLKLSNALTMLGADLASVRNMDFSKVWTDLQSGLAGMSRTMDKYGSNIRLVNLQLKLNEIGIVKSVSALNQNEKALLRTIIMLDSTRYSWADLSETINQPANQLRLLSANFENLGRTIGNLFLPIVSKILPYINALTISLQRLFSWVGNLAGVDLSKITSSATSVDLSGLLGTDEATDGINSATNALKKLKTVTLGIDELNINAPQSESGSDGSGVGLGSFEASKLNEAFNKAVEEYQKMWDEAFARMESKAQAFADKFSKIFQPIEKLFKDISIGDWFSVGGDVSDIAIGIFDFFTDALKKVNWKKIGNNIGDFLSGIKWKDVLMSAGNFFETLIDSAIDLWKGSFETAPIETAIITALAIAQFTGLNGIIASKIVSAFPATLSVGKTIAIVGLTFTIGFDVGKEIGKLLFPEDAEYYENFSWFGENGFFSSFTDGSWKKALKMWGDDINKWMEDTFGDWAGTTFSDAWEGVKSWWSTDVVGAFKLWGQDVANWWTEDVTPWFTAEKWLELLENIKTSFSTKWSEIKEWWNTCALVLWWTEDVMPWFTAEKWSELWENVKESFSTKWGEIKSWWSTTAIAKWWKEDVQPWFTKKKWVDAMIGIKEAFENTWNSAIACIKGIWNKFAIWLNENLTINIDTSNLIGKGIADLLGTSTLKLANLPTFQTGGFPEDGLFMANHNELVGQFSNGKTAVANNEQIIEGIKRGVAEANSEEILLLRQQNELLMQLLEKDMSVNIGDREIARANARGQKSLGYQLVT